MSLSSFPRSQWIKWALKRLYCSLQGKERIPEDGVFINTSADFLVGCDCTDGCRDKWVQLHIHTSAFFFSIFLSLITFSSCVSASEFQVQVFVPPADPPGYRLYSRRADQPKRWIFAQTIRGVPSHRVSAQTKPLSTCDAVRLALTPQTS